MKPQPIHDPMSLASRMGCVLLACLLLAAATCHAEPASSAEEVLKGMLERFAELKDYRCLVEAQSERPKPSRMLIRYTFRKPNRIRMDLQQPRRGAVVIYTGGDRVRVRRFRWLPITLAFSVTDARLKSPQGHQVDQTDFGSFLEGFTRDAAQGMLTYGGEEVVEGRRTHRIELVRESHKLTRDFRRMTVWVDAEMRLPAQIEAFGWEGGRIEKVVFRNLEVDVGVTEGTFSF